MNKELAHKNFELNQEISERERLNQVIQNSAREHRAIINAVSDIIFEVSLDGKILFLNEAWNKVTEFELERSIGRNLFDLIYTQDQDEQRHNFTLLTQGKKKSYRVFTRLRSADGSFRAIELAVSMLRQGDNQDMRVVGTITDVEERRRAERALSEAEKKYRAIVENAAGGIYQVTPEGQFLSANPALAKIIGYDSPEEVLRDVESAQDQLYVDKEGRAKFLSDISVLDISKNYEGQIKRKDGQIIWVSENIRPVKDDEGTLLFFEGSMEDVDQRRKAELALKDAKIESDLANRAKSEFLANMSHELRTPLNAVIGFSEIIKNESFGPLPSEEYKDYANSIYDSGQNLLNVINDILDVSRIEAGDRTLNEGVVKVSEIVDSCLSLMDTKIKNNKIQLQNKVAQSDLSFIGEKHAVKQMLLNLISNAVKFSPENSLIMLDAELDSKSRLRLSVTDTGIGMNEYELKKALSPFGQIDTEHNRSKSGTGLGLTLVKSLMELHGGEFEIVSQKGIGTTATLIFPTKRVARAKPQAAKNPEDSYDDFADITEMKDA
jgi:PAS domain S-box-containing protein